METRKRRFLPIVYRSHQYRFLALIVFYTTSIVAMLFFSLFFPDILQMQDESLNMDVRRLAADKVLTLHLRLWPAVIAMVSIFSLHSFLFFHRFVGPLYRFNAAFKKMGDGDLSEHVKLRTNDFLVDEEAGINRMMDSLSSNMAKMRGFCSEALETLNRVEAQGNTEEGANGWDEAECTRLRGNLEALKETLDGYRLPAEQASSEDETV